MIKTLSVTFANDPFPSVLETAPTIVEQPSPVLFLGEDGYLREGFRADVTRTLVAAPCSPPTPPGELDNFASSANQHGSRLSGIVNALNGNSLHMTAFAGAVNDYAGFLRSLPASFCVGPSNQANFNALNQAIANASNVAQRGVSIFESNFDRYCSSATNLLNQVGQACAAVNASTRDFRPVLNAVSQYQRFVSGYSVEVWNLSQRIQVLGQDLGSRINATEGALRNATAQIETNVEADAQTIAQQATNCEAAYKTWEKVNGKDGYRSYMETARFTAQVLVPPFNDLLQKVPNTNRVRAAVQRAQQALNYISTNVDSFPTFQPLPLDSATFPHTTYGSDEKQYGGANIMAVLQAACTAHFSATSKKLNIGNMQWQHGGYMDPHRSHKEGRDADLVVPGVGVVPDHDTAAALAATKEFLSAGAVLVLFADQSVVDDANAWAREHGVSGHASYEASHTDHFHLRAPL